MTVGDLGDDLRLAARSARRCSDRAAGRSRPIALSPLFCTTTRSCPVTSAGGGIEAAPRSCSRSTAASSFGPGRPVESRVPAAKARRIMSVSGMSRRTARSGNLPGDWLPTNVGSATSAQTARETGNRERIGYSGAGGDGNLQYTARSVLTLLDERPVPQLGVSLLQLFPGVHHDRPVPGDGLLDRLPRHEQEPDPGVSRLDRHLVAAIEQHQ